MSIVTRRAPRTSATPTGGPLTFPGAGPHPNGSTDGRIDTATDAGTAGALRFPPDFGWGAATSAYQIEGAAK